MVGHGGVSWGWLGVPAIDFGDVSGRRAGCRGQKQDDDDQVEHGGEQTAPSFNYSLLSEFRDWILTGQEALCPWSQVPPEAMFFHFQACREAVNDPGPRQDPV